MGGRRARAKRPSRLATILGGLVFLFLLRYYLSKGQDSTSSGALHSLKRWSGARKLPGCVNLALKGSNAWTCSYGPEKLLSQSMIEITVDTSAYWEGILTSRDSSTLITVYRDHDRPKTGWLYVPNSGDFTLTIYTPQSANTTGRIMEPNWCWGMQEANPVLRDILEEAVPTMFPEAWDHCGLYNEQDHNDVRAVFGAANVPITYPRADAKIFESTLTFASKDVTSEGELAANFQGLSYRVHGSAASKMIRGGIDTLGYWHRASKHSLQPGHSDYQPQPQSCPLTFQTDVKNHQKTCDFSKPAYRWTPFSQARKDWLIGARQLTECYDAKKIVIIGDSLSLALYRGMHCFAGGYGNASELDQHLIHSHAAIEFLPFFSPEELDIKPTFPDYLYFHRYEQAIQATDYIWHFGMWMVSYVPSVDWETGLEAFFDFIEEDQRRSKKRARHWFSLITSPHTDLERLGTFGVGYQTAERANQWNDLVRRKILERDVTLLDYFTPSISRWDARTDNCHFCDTLSYEFGAMTWTAMCT